MSGPGYAELALTTNFSFLHGASHPQEYVAQGAAYGLAALGIADRNTVAGVVRAHAAAQALEAEGTVIRILPGVRLVTEDGFEAVTYPMDRPAWGRLCRLLTLGNRRVRKGECRFSFAEVLEAAEGQVFIAMPSGRRPHPSDGFRARLEALAAAAPGRTWLGASHARRGDERRRLGLLAELGAASGAPMVAVSDALYHHPDRRPLQDVLTCIREKLHHRRGGLPAGGQCRAPPETGRARWPACSRGHRTALARTVEIAALIDFDLRQLQLSVSRRAGAARARPPSAACSSPGVKAARNGAFRTACPQAW